MEKALFCEDFGDLEQIQGRSAPVLSLDSLHEHGCCRATITGKSHGVRAAGPEYIQPIKLLKEHPKPTAACPEPTALKKLQDFEVAKCLT